MAIRDGSEFKAKGIVVFGLNGVGKSTLGRALAESLNYNYIDAEDYFFKESSVPFSEERSKEEVIKLMISDIEKHGNFVLCSVKGNYGDLISSHYQMGVLIDVSYEVRIDRIIKRSKDRFGNRVEEGGDMYESEKAFLDFVKNRKIESVEAWSETLHCDVIQVDGTKSVEDNVDLIKEIYLELMYK